MSKKPKHGSNRGDSEDEYNDNEEDGQNENDFYICQNKPIASKLKKQKGVKGTFYSNITLRCWLYRIIFMNNLNHWL